jgi:hypothetical protein
VVVLVKLSDRTEAFNGFDDEVAGRSYAVLDGGTAAFPPLHAANAKEQRTTKRPRDFTRANLLPRKKLRTRTSYTMRGKLAIVPGTNRTNAALSLREIQKVDFVRTGSSVACKFAAGHRCWR